MTELKAKSLYISFSTKLNFTEFLHFVSKRLLPTFIILTNFEFEYLSIFIQEAHIYTDMYFCYIVYTKYSGSQSHIAVSFNAVRGYETRRI